MCHFRIDQSVTLCARSAVTVGRRSGYTAAETIFIRSTTAEKISRPSRMAAATANSSSSICPPTSATTSFTIPICGQARSGSISIYFPTDTEPERDANDREATHALVGTARHSAFRSFARDSAIVLIDCSACSSTPSQPIGPNFVLWDGAEKSAMSGKQEFWMGRLVSNFCAINPVRPRSNIA